MSKKYQFVCDGCGSVLHGPDRGAFISKDYFQIKGQITLQEVDKTTEKRQHTFLTRSPNEELSFCNIECLQEYMDTQKRVWENRQKAYLREEATENENARLTGRPRKKKEEYAFTSILED